MYGTSGMSGTVAELDDYNPDLVTSETSGGKRASTDLTIVSPFTGKGRVFRKYLNSLDRLPCSTSHAIIYDNSCDARFRKRLTTSVLPRFQSWELVTDKHKPVTWIQNEPVNQWKMIAARLGRVYWYCYKRIPPCRYVLNLEDDVEIPEDAWQKLQAVMDMDSDVGTVIGACNDRRDAPDYASFGKPIAFNFQVSQVLGPSGQDPDHIGLIQLPSRDFGIEQIGAGHMGCWLTRRTTVEDVPMGEPEIVGLAGTDIVWGWNLYKRGWRFATDWSVKCQHWSTRGNRIVSV